jgi:hypothetical protein
MFLHNLLNVLVQIANKMGLQKNIGKHRSTFGSISVKSDHAFLSARLNALVDNKTKDFSSSRRKYETLPGSPCSADSRRTPEVPPL